MDDAYIYIIIVFAGIPAYLYNLTANCNKSARDSRLLYFSVVAACPEYSHDFVSIKFMGLRLQDLPYAGLYHSLYPEYCVVYMVKFDILKLEPKIEGALSMSHVKVVLSMGIPMGLRCSITAIGSALLQAAVNGLGAVWWYSYRRSKISSFCVAVTDALERLCGQNVGAGKLDRVKRKV